MGEYFDLRDAELSVKLRGRNLDLGKAEVTLWVVCEGTRWHFIGNFLQIQNGVWTENKIKMRNNQDDWHNSWSRGGQQKRFCLDKVESMGFAFRKFPRGEKVKGIFEMDELSVRKN